MNICYEDERCVAWRYYAAYKKCSPQTTALTTYVNSAYTAGSCIGKSRDLFLLSFLQLIYISHSARLTLFVCRTDVKLQATTCGPVQTGGYYYGDWFQVTGSFTSSSDCLARCQASKACVAWRYIVSANACYLQSTIQIWINDGSYHAGSCLSE